MKYSARLSDAVHILAFILENKNEKLTSADIAVSIQTNPSYIRQLMAQLKKADLLITQQGQARPMLGKSPQEITLLMIYRAVEGEKPLLHLDTHTNPACGVGVHIQLSLAEYYQRIQQKAEQEMDAITLADIMETFHQKIKKSTAQ